MNVKAPEGAVPEAAGCLDGVFPREDAGGAGRDRSDSSGSADARLDGIVVAGGSE